MKTIVEEKAEKNNEHLIRTILTAKEKGAVIVCQDPLNLIRIAYSLGITGVQYISYKDFTALPKKNGSYMFDEIDKYVQSIIDKQGTLIGYSLYY